MKLAALCTAACAALGVAAWLFLMRSPAAEPHAIPRASAASDGSSAPPLDAIATDGEGTDTGDEAAGADAPARAPVAAAGVSLRGRVVDVDGRPVSDVELRFSQTREPHRAHSAHSNAIGEFTLGGIDEPSEFEIEVTSSDHALVHDEDGDAARPPDASQAWEAARSGRRPKPRVTVPSDAELVLRVWVKNVLSGRVVDAAGAPVAGASVAMLRGGVAIERGVAAANGAFRLATFVDGPVEVAAASADAACGVRRAGPFAFGTPVEIVLPASHRLAIAVVDAITGEPVERFAVRTRPEGSELIDIDPLRLGGEHAGGLLEVTGLWAGATHLAVIPADARLARAVVRIETPGDGAPVRIALARRPTVRVRATWPNGTPAAGLRVLAITSQSRKLGAHVVDPDAIPVGELEATYRRLPLIECTGTTDADGCVELGARADARGLVLRVEVGDGDYQDEVVAWPQSTGFVPITLRKAQAMPVTGRLTWSYPPGWSVELRLRGSGIIVDSMPQAKPTARMGDGGRVVALDDGGRFTLALRAPTTVSPRLTVHDASDRYVGTTILPEVAAAPGDHIELAAPALGRIEGTATLDGAPVRGEVALFALADAGKAMNGEKDAVRVPLAEDGSFVFGPLFPRKYRVRLESGHGRPRAIWSQGGAVDVPAGGTARVDVALRKRTAEFHVRRHDGTPAAGDAFVVAFQTTRETVVADTNGCVRVDYVPNAGVMKLVRKEASAAALARIELVPERDTYAVDVVLAAPPPPR